MARVSRAAASEETTRGGGSWCPRLPLAGAEPVLPVNRRGRFNGHISKPNHQDANLPLRVVVFKVHWAATRQLKALFSFILTR